jgi:short-subunit dehydrogenase involved in D-alanine esterification of teichoic acids
MSKKFAGKIEVVTGGFSGMDLATARRFVKEGMDHEFISGRRNKPLDGAVAEIGKNVTAVQEVMQRTYLTSIACRMTMPGPVR